MTGVHKAGGAVNPLTARAVDSINHEGTKMVFHIKDAEKFKTPSVLKLIFFRNENNKDVSMFFWFKILITELFFAEEILDNLVMTSSYNNTGSFDLSGGAKDSGWNRQICYHIPNGIVNNFFIKPITEMIFIKYYRQYLIIETDSQLIPINGDNSIDISEVDFKVSKERLHQFMELKKLYNFIGVISNILIDSIVYLATKRIDFAILSGAFIEWLRKIRF